MVQIKKAVLCLMLGLPGMAVANTTPTNPVLDLIYQNQNGENIYCYDFGNYIKPNDSPVIGGGGACGN